MRAFYHKGGYPRMTHQMPLLHNGTQRNHNNFSSDVPSNAVLVWHQMQNFFGKLWMWLCIADGGIASILPCFHVVSREYR